MRRQRSRFPVFLVALVLTACGASKPPQVRWGAQSTEDKTVEIEFGKGQNGSDLLLTLFKQVASAKDAVITDLTIHFIWDATRLMECSTAIMPLSELATHDAPDPHPWIALRVEAHQVSEEDYVCQTVLEQIIVPKGDKQGGASRGARRTPSPHPEVEPAPFGEPKLVPRTRCSRMPVERTVMRYLHQVYEEWIPPNWTYIATQITIPLLREAPASCTPIDARSGRLLNRLTARVRRGS